MDKRLKKTVMKVVVLAAIHIKVGLMAPLVASSLITWVAMPIWWDKESSYYRKSRSVVLARGAASRFLRAGTGWAVARASDRRSWRRRGPALPSDRPWETSTPPRRPICQGARLTNDNHL